MMINEFLQKVYDDDISSLDVYNYVEQVTSNFERDKLKMLENDFNWFLAGYYGQIREAFTSEYDQSEFDKIYKEARSKRFGNILLLNEGGSLIGFTDGQFKSIITFAGLLFKKQEGVGEKNIEKIIWLESLESLRMLLESLKECHHIIDEDTDVMIRDHFKVNADLTVKNDIEAETTSINWLKSQRLFIYLISKLEDNNFVAHNREWSLYTKHFINSFNKFKVQSLKSESSNMYNNFNPKGSDYIDLVIESLKQKPLPE